MFPSIQTIYLKNFKHSSLFFQCFQLAIYSVTNLHKITRVKLNFTGDLKVIIITFEQFKKSISTLYSFSVYKYK